MTTTDPAHDPPTLLSLVDAQHEARTHTGAPEALFISALLATGDYTPAAHGVPPAWFAGYSQLHQFCLDYQEAEGCAPPVQLVTTRFPSFVFTPDVGPTWAAHELSLAVTNRTLRRGITKALKSVGEEAYGEAVGALRDTIDQVVTTNRPGTLLTDFSGARAHAERDHCPVPPGVLAKVTGGHGAGQLWLVAALWGVGKTFKLVDHAIAAAEGGWDVVFFSLEMTTEDILSRLRAKVLSRLRHPLMAVDLDVVESMVKDWASRSGSIQVRGPDRGRLDVSVIAGAIGHPRTLVIVDYTGKMFASDGRHAGSGWEAFSMVSKELAQAAGWHNVPVLGAAQVNRTGQLGGTISLEQDADLILELRKVGKAEGIRQNILVKSRHTPLHPPWYSRFDPVGARFDDISGEEAMSMRMAEEALLYS